MLHLRRVARINRWRRREVLRGIEALWRHCWFSYELLSELLVLLEKLWSSHRALLPGSGGEDMCCLVSRMNSSCCFLAHTRLCLSSEELGASVSLRTAVVPFRTAPLFVVSVTSQLQCRTLIPLAQFLQSAGIDFLASTADPGVFPARICKRDWLVGSGLDPDLQMDIISELDLVNTTRGVTQVSGQHNGSKAFLFQVRWAALWRRECGDPRMSLQAQIGGRLQDSS
ncbi:uncharacterized protein LOC134470340 isoform X2 [Cavia porcellus]|uniref:uncharacterized protein LOC134470340 isoform X2 n=1 Tax=Cavia porcellus TaxID=10141 RepID=UPI002FE2A2D2